MPISTRVAAATLGVDLKKLDNILVRTRHLAVAGHGHGRERQIQEDSLETIAVGLLLQRDLGVSLERAIEMASAIRSSASGEIPVGALGSLRFDIARLKSVLQQALADAIEGDVAPRRGRPRKVGT